jgi:hypothetical protein
MIRSFAALALFTLLGAWIMALPGFSLPAKASEAEASTKADRLPVHNAAGACSGQVWPNFSASCLHTTGTSSLVSEARLVTARR